MILDRVTITGADDTTHIKDVIELSKKYPFVEWGILLSASNEGTARYPGLGWIEELMDVADRWQLRLSGHLCGQWVRALCLGHNRFQINRPTIAGNFQRIQLNFHAQEHDIEEDRFVQALKLWNGPEQFIFQFDDVNDKLMGKAIDGGLACAPLFDTSGGRGVYPATWPAPIGGYSGYAGGLHPDQIDAQLKDIEAAAGIRQEVWVDVETHVRPDDDSKLDIDKTDKFLAACKPWVQRQRE